MTRSPTLPLLQLFDDDMNGFIEFAEIKALYARAVAESGGRTAMPSDAELKQMLAEVAADGAAVSFDDFTALTDAQGTFRTATA